MHFLYLGNSARHLAIQSDVQVLTTLTAGTSPWTFLAQSLPIMMPLSKIEWQEHHAGYDLQKIKFDPEQIQPPQSPPLNVI
jgi:hypothetical protein